MKKILLIGACTLLLSACSACTRYETQDLEVGCVWVKDYWTGLPVKTGCRTEKQNVCVEYN